MKKNSFIISLLILTSLSTSLSAQTFRKAYAVNQKNDTIYGEAMLDMYSKMAKKIFFAKRKGKIKTLSPKDYKEVFIYPDALFRSEYVHYNYKKIDSLNGIYFLRVIVDGDKRLLSTDFRDTKLYFSQKANDNPSVLYHIKRQPIITARVIDLQNSSYINLKIDRNNDRNFHNDTVTEDLSQKIDYSNIWDKKVFIDSLVMFFQDCNAHLMQKPVYLQEASLLDTYKEHYECKQEKFNPYFQKFRFKTNIFLRANVGIASYSDADANINMTRVGLSLSLERKRIAVLLGGTYGKNLYKKPSNNPTHFYLGNVGLDYKLVYRKKISGGIGAHLDFFMFFPSFNAFLSYSFIPNQRLELRASYAIRPSASIDKTELYTHKYIDMSYYMKILDTKAKIFGFYILKNQP